MKNNSNTPKSIGREIWEWVYTIFIALVIAFAIKTFLFELVKVDGQSMDDTLHHGERLIVAKLGYEPEQGDIVILDSTFKNRQEYYSALAEEKGKNELSPAEKFIENFSLPADCKSKFYVKRVIALPGQTVDIKDGDVYVDGTVIEEDYIKGTTYPTDPSVKYPVTVEEDHVFVMGDNREHSTDSRVSSLGQVPFDAISGKSVFRIWPFNKMGTTK